VRRWAYYGRTAQGQIITRIELGVKVITNKGAMCSLSAVLTLSSRCVQRDFAIHWLTKPVMQQVGLSAVTLTSHTVQHSRAGGSIYTLKSILLTCCRGRKVMAAFPGVEVTTKHDYEIAYKFSWRCLAPSCGHMQVSVSAVTWSLTVH